jgi:uncharacterized membrane protein YccC
MIDKTKKVILRMTTAVGGVLGFVLLMWTPKTGKVILAYVAIFAVLAVIAIAVAPTSAGYWPGKHEDH